MPHREKIDKSRTSEKTPLLSYFTGAGLLDIGFMNYDFEMIWRNENNSVFVRGFEYAMSTLFKSNGDHKVSNTNSILEITPKQVAKEAFHNTQKPETFGIIGGPPCQDFSAGGKNLGGEGLRGKLAEIFADHIIALQPSFFLMENVKGLFKTEKHRKFLNKLIAKLSKDYCTSVKILNALEYGVPQNRERGFLVGLNKKWLKKHFDFPSNLNSNFPTFPWPEKSYDLPKTSYEWPKQTPFRSTPEKPLNIPEELMVGTWICNSGEDLTLLSNGLDYFNPKSKKFEEIDEGDDSRKSFKRLHRWRYSPTAAYGNNEVHLHPIHARRLSVREVMRIQTVPDAYSLPYELSLTHKFKMIGNGVPVGLAKAIASSFNGIVTGLWRENLLLGNQQ